jgi:hypothetical protein
MSAQALLGSNAAAAAAAASVWQFASLCLNDTLAHAQAHLPLRLLAPRMGCEKSSPLM